MKMISECNCRNCVTHTQKIYSICECTLCRNLEIEFCVYDLNDKDLKRFYLQFFLNVMIDNSKDNCINSIDHSRESIEALYHAFIDEKMSNYDMINEIEEYCQL